MLRVSRALGALTLAAGLACAGGATAAGKATTHTIVIEAVQYTPQALVVERGDTIVWVNKDPFPHTVTAKGAFDSHDIAAGKSWKYVARKAGEYAYICTLHPNMHGTLTVK
ncbi:MAG TPA: cupredoxin family copper-binding protein [Casimicrobiaceae bacterium]